MQPLASPTFPLHGSSQHSVSVPSNTLQIEPAPLPFVVILWSRSTLMENGFLYFASQFETANPKAEEGGMAPGWSASVAARV